LLFFKPHSWICGQEKGKRHGKEWEGKGKAPERRGGMRGDGMEKGEKGKGKGGEGKGERNRMGGDLNTVSLFYLL